MCYWVLSSESSVSSVSSLSNLWAVLGKALFEMCWFNMGVSQLTSHSSEFSFHSMRLNLHLLLFFFLFLYDCADEYSKQPFSWWTVVICV